MHTAIILKTLQPRDADNRNDFQRYGKLLIYLFVEKVINLIYF